MFLSYIYSVTDQSLDEAKRTLDAIYSQEEKDYEVIIVSDFTENTELNTYINSFFWKHKNCKLVENATSQGIAVSWNVGIEMAQGEYVLFINESDKVAPTHAKVLKNTIAQYGKVDLVEYYIHLNGLADSNTKSFVDKNVVISLKESLEPFAYVNDFLQAKIFRLSLIKDFTFRFRRFVRYDMLFIYKFLGQAKTYLFLDAEPLLTTNVEETSYSIFDLITQWPHIFNYYRRIGRFKELNDYLTYSYYKILVHIWPWWIRKYNNKVLTKKAVNSVQRKFQDKREEFMETNPIFLYKRDKAFVDCVENFNKWLKEVQKTI